MNRMRASFAVLLGLSACIMFFARASAQEGKIRGKVTDESGNPLSFTNVVVEGTRWGASSNVQGEYLIPSVEAGGYTVKASAVGYRPQSASVTVAAGQTAQQDYTLAIDVLRMDEVVVTGTMAPRQKLESTVAISTLTPREIVQAAPRSTTEILRYIPGFTRVESSGGEVNQNISMRGILGVEYVMFMEDGMPVFPTMHTFFMNADNLFRLDENIERVEVVRGGSSALFGSNTPGAIINFINKTGGPEIGGSVKASGGTGGLARYDLNLNGPLGEAWRFNLGGFYRYDRGVRDPGFPGTAGGQFKANITRLLDNGFVRTSLKIIDDRNQFILPLPFKNPDDPKYVDGFSETGSMNSEEGNHVRVPTPIGELELPLDHGLRTKAYWLTADIGFDFADGWNIQNTAQLMRNDQEWNAILPFDVLSSNDWLQSLGFPAGSTYQLFYTNHVTSTGARLAFNTANGLVSPGGEWHVEKPLTAFQDQLQIRKAIGDHKVSVGLYFANYTQTNNWYFTDILMDVRDNPRFLDLIVYTPVDTVYYTKNGFRKFVSLYRNGSGSTTVFSAMGGGEFVLTDRLRADIGFRYESNDFVQTAENYASQDLDGDTSTTYDNVQWGNGSFRHFSRRMTNWAGSAGLNYSVTEGVAVYVQGSRAFKMPALDEFLDAQAQEQVNLYDARETFMVEGGVKYTSPKLGFTVNGFWGELRNIIGQGAETNPVTGEIRWVLRASPNNRAYGAEVEVSANPTPGLSLIGAGTFLSTQTIEAAGAALTAGGTPSALANLSASYSVSGFSLVADWHFVGERKLIDAQYDQAAGKFTKYDEVGKLKAYQYVNLGASYAFPGQAITLSANVLNVSQSFGFEEGNPRLVGAGGRNLFLARPLLPTRLVASLSYRF